MPPANKEKKGLTLEKLASYDDVITDALVDKVYYWTSIRKNRGGRFTGMRGLHEEDIAAIIRQHVAWGKDPVEAVQKLLLLPGLKKYLTSLKNDGEKEQFKRHLRRYVNIYMPDCPFEVTTTNRYTITEHEASVTARRDLNPREEIKYLTGVQVAMTEQQEKSLELARKDFSLVYSSRKKTRSLFLGPARFANHDCDPNAKLSTKGYDGMQIVAVKPIDQGEEITVSYGSDYFGENNEECLCQTCENRQQNGWAPMRPAERSDEEDGAEAEEPVNAGAGASIEQEIAPTSDDASKKRQRDESTPESASESTATEPATKRVRIEHSSSSLNRHVPDLLREQTLKKAHESSLRHEIPIFSIEDTSLNPNPSLSVFQEMRRAQQPGSLLTAKLDETSSSREATPQSPVASSISKASEGTDATSVDDDHPSENTLPHVKVDPETLSDHPALGVATVKEEVTLTATDDVPWPSPPAEEVADDSNSELSSMSSSLEFDSEHEQLVKRKPQPFLRTTRSKSRFDTANRIGTPILLPTLSPSTRYVPNKRHLGDYMTAPSLLSAKYSKWVECQTCDAHFVQQDGYHTRKECPRCERHSKLYGYPWPKTEKEGKNDKEERIADHRTVHRFVDPQQEKQLKKNGGRRGMKNRVSERFSTPRSASLLDGGSGSASGSGSARSSASAEGEGPRRRRRVRMTM